MNMSLVPSWPIFIKEEKENPDKCIWWHENRQWWMGECRYIGNKTGCTHLCV